LLLTLVFTLALLFFSLSSSFLGVGVYSGALFTFIDNASFSLDCNKLANLGSDDENSCLTVFKAFSKCSGTALTSSSGLWIDLSS
jgi:hypothetical protein